jgi:hypothetical protein
MDLMLCENAELTEAALNLLMSQFCKIGTLCNMAISLKLLEIDTEVLKAEKNTESLNYLLSQFEAHEVWGLDNEFSSFDGATCDKVIETLEWLYGALFPPKLQNASTKKFQAIKKSQTRRNSWMRRNTGKTAGPHEELGEPSRKAQDFYSRAGAVDVLMMGFQIGTMFKQGLPDHLQQVFKRCSLVLEAIVRENATLQDTLAKFTEELLVYLPFDVGVNVLLATTYGNNEKLCAALSERTIYALCNANMAQPSHMYLSLLESWIVPSNRELILRLLLQMTNDECLPYDLDPISASFQRQLQHFKQADQGDPCAEQKKILFLCALRLLGRIAFDRMRFAEVKIQSIFPLDHMLAALQNPQLPYELRSAVAILFHTSMLVTEVKLVDLEHKDAVWSLLRSFVAPLKETEWQAVTDTSQTSFYFHGVLPVILCFSMFFREYWNYDMATWKEREHAVEVLEAVVETSLWAAMEATGQDRHEKLLNKFGRVVMGNEMPLSLPLFDTPGDFVTYLTPRNSRKSIGKLQRVTLTGRNFEARLQYELMHLWKDDTDMMAAIDSEIDSAVMAIHQLEKQCKVEPGCQESELRLTRHDVYKKLVRFATALDANVNPLPVMQVMQLLDHMVHYRCTQLGERQQAQHEIVDYGVPVMLVDVLSQCTQDNVRVVRSALVLMINVLTDGDFQNVQQAVLAYFREQPQIQFFLR